MTMLGEGGFPLELHAPTVVAGSCCDQAWGMLSTVKKGLPVTRTPVGEDLKHVRLPHSPVFLIDRSRCCGDTALKLGIHLKCEGHHLARRRKANLRRMQSGPALFAYSSAFLASTQAIGLDLHLLAEMGCPKH